MKNRAKFFDEAEVRKTVAAFVPAGSVFEVRALSAQLRGERKVGTVSGYFNDADRCIAELEKLSSAKAIYFTLNPIMPALLSRCENRLAYADKNALTGDQHVLERRSLLIDIDVDRPSGISATDEEKERARKKALEVFNFLKKRQWLRPLVADSGNGYHLIYRTNLPLDDGGLLKDALAALADHFDGDGVKLDRTVHNPARIVRLYGTVAQKGDNTRERPHRPTRILRIPNLFANIRERQLQRLVEELQPAGKTEEQRAPRGAFDVEDFLKRHEIAAEKSVEPDGSSKWTLAACPFNPDHADAAVFQHADGKLGFKCFHSSCSSKHWREFREHFEPVTTQPTPSRDSDWATDLSAFTSLDETRFPAPLGADAFHGLAEKIVQRILPHTEADPAALLFTFLTGFGNMIGRTAHMVADGARHYLNLFVVTVGRTAISRKRTAWVRIRPALKLLDEDWVKDNVEFGLSSGEGVVHRIRDKIDEEKPIKEKGRFTGEYQTVTVDPGIDDKRLCVLETEFCSPLKVMNREGNTLSPVLRAAWDGDNLGTLTKNSKERATAPHVSMVGHITREELRQTLNETEAANGFGNRILWSAAKRSKVLPSSSAIPDMREFVDALGEAHLFAQSCCELKRDAEAEELWAQVYPKLSEGEPGLIGAIIARAAPQVLRLSAIYAVLDCSPAVRVEHLKAALACWQYAEASARWIFETGTGNRVADRILTALIASHGRGLTKTEIVHDLFNRHVTKFTIDEALRLLHHLSLAFPQSEATKGRPIERWFFKSPGDKSDISEKSVCDESLAHTDKSLKSLKSPELSKNEKESEPS